MLKHKILSDACANNKLIAFRTEKEEWGGGNHHRPCQGSDFATYYYQ